MRARSYAQIIELTSRLEDEKSRRKAAARQALQAEAETKEAVAAEQRRRLQLENAARLERTARKDLQEERELIKNLLLRSSLADHKTPETTPVKSASKSGGAHRGKRWWRLTTRSASASSLTGVSSFMSPVLKMPPPMPPPPAIMNMTSPTKQTPPPPANTPTKPAKPMPTPPTSAEKPAVKVKKSSTTRESH